MTDSQKQALVAFMGKLNSLAATDKEFCEAMESLLANGIYSIEFELSAQRAAAPKDSEFLKMLRINPDIEVRE